MEWRCAGQGSAFSAAGCSGGVVVIPDGVVVARLVPKRSVLQEATISCLSESDNFHADRPRCSQAVDLVDELPEEGMEKCTDYVELFGVGRCFLRWRYGRC